MATQAAERITIIGTGVAGASWAPPYLAREFDGIATDPGPNAEVNLRHYVDTARWGLLPTPGLLLPEVAR